MTPETLSRETGVLLAEFGIAGDSLSGAGLPVFSPIDGSRIAELRRHDEADLERMIAAAERAFTEWRSVPPPRRGELLRLFAEGPRRQKTAPARRGAIEARTSLAGGPRGRKGVVE